MDLLTYHRITTAIRIIRQQLDQLEQLAHCRQPPEPNLQDAVTAAAATWTQPIPAAKFYRRLKLSHPHHTRGDVIAALIQLGYQRRKYDTGICWIKTA